MCVVGMRPRFWENVPSCNRTAVKRKVRHTRLTTRHMCDALVLACPLQGSHCSQQAHIPFSYTFVRHTGCAAVARPDYMQKTYSTLSAACD